MRHWTPILVLLLAAVGSALIHVTLTKQYENWVTAPGEITRVELYMNHRKLGSGKSQRIFDRYTVDGVTYEGSELFFPVGTRIVRKGMRRRSGTTRKAQPCPAMQSQGRG